MPHPKYVAVRQIPPSPGKGEGQMPGVCPVGGMCEFRIDRYVNSACSPPVASARRTLPIGSHLAITWPCRIDLGLSEAFTTLTGKPPGRRLTSAPFTNKSLGARRPPAGPISHCPCPLDSDGMPHRIVSPLCAEIRKFCMATTRRQLVRTCATGLYRGTSSAPIRSVPFATSPAQLLPAWSQGPRCTRPWCRRQVYPVLSPPRQQSRSSEAPFRARGQFRRSLSSRGWTWAWCRVEGPCHVASGCQGGLSLCLSQYQPPLCKGSSVRSP